MVEDLLLVLLTVGIYAISAGRRFGHFSAISLFIYAQSAMAVGTLSLLSTGIQADTVHRDLILATLGILVGVAMIFAFTSRTTAKRGNEPSVDYSYPKVSVWTWIWISLAITALYYWSVGYLAFFESIQAIIAGSDIDISGLRLESYSGSRYFFPGYVNQFKNSLLPALALVVIISAFHFQTRRRYLMTFLLSIAGVIALLGTGQRGAFVIVALVGVVMTSLIKPRESGKYLFRAAIIGVPIFFLATFAGGRANSALQQAGGADDVISVLFSQLVFRLFGSNQYSSVVGFRYVFDREITNGGEWARGIIGLIPGQPGSDLSNQIYAVFYGTTRGTAPVSVWGSAFHNFGFAGAVVVALVLAVILCLLSISSKNIAETNLIRTAGVAGVTVTLGMWIADGPTSLLNTGIGLYTLLWWWGSVIASRKAKLAPLSTEVAHGG